MTDITESETSVDETLAPLQDDPAEEALAEDAAEGDSDADPITKEWTDAYPEGTELFCAEFAPEDFDPFYGLYADGPKDGATVAIRRCTSTPSQGWIMAHAHLSDLERTKVLLDMHSCPEAMAILLSLKDEPLDEFTTAWGKDGGLVPKGFTRSARRGANKKRR